MTKVADPKTAKSPYPTVASCVFHDDAKQEDRDPLFVFAVLYSPFVYDRISAGSIHC
jgi:hypothetical protein